MRLYASKVLPFAPYAATWFAGTASLAVVGQSASSAGVLQILSVSSSVSSSSSSSSEKKKRENGDRKEEAEEEETGEGQAELVVVLETEKRTPFRCLCALDTAYGAGGGKAQNNNGTARVATGDFDGWLAVWDVHHLEAPLFTAQAQPHEATAAMINAVDAAGPTQQDAREIATGGRDGAVLVWDIRQRDKAVIAARPYGTEKRDCWAVRFCTTNAHRGLMAGFENGDLACVDLRMASVLWQMPLPSGICSIDASASDQLTVGGTENLLVHCAVSDGQQKEKKSIDVTPVTIPRAPETKQPAKQAAATTVWTVRSFRSREEGQKGGGSDLVVGVGDSNGCLHVFKKGSSEKAMAVRSSARLSKQPVASLDWHPNFDGLFACTSFDRTLRIGYL